MAHDPAAAPAPFPAASVILLREPAAGGIEVCMLRRRRGASFMASAFVFPGGGADPDEHLATCAARELFEEAGVALLERPAPAERLAELRKRAAAGASTHEVIADAGLRFDEQQLLPWSHWITPSLEPRRFSAHFFVAALPEGQAPRFDDVETVEQIWINPVDAAARAGDLALPPPQLRTLWELRELTSIDQVRRAARARALDPFPILPRVSMLAPPAPTAAPGDKGPRLPVCLLLPWDPEYLEKGQGEAMPMDHRPAWAHGPSRFVMEDRAWRHLDAPGSTSAG
jgi:8-oxo-dGTP pyrophosphatase MutT (NUDIX family)